MLDGMIARNTAAGALTVALGRTAGAAGEGGPGPDRVEAENAFARAMVDDGVLTDDDIALVHEEKRQIVRKSGVLEFVGVDVGLDDIGGLENLKTVAAQAERLLAGRGARVRAAARPRACSSPACRAAASP